MSRDRPMPRSRQALFDALEKLMEVQRLDPEKKEQAYLMIHRYPTTGKNEVLLHGQPEEIMDLLQDLVGRFEALADEAIDKTAEGEGEEVASA